jgi:sugar (pentulose or hexulose) kinase
MRPSPVFSAPKIQFVREQMPELYEKSEKLVGFCEYSLHLLTKNFATDYSIASRTCLFDITTRSWSDYLLGLFAIDTEKLCPLVEVGSVVGTTTREVTEMLSLAKPVPVISAGGDQQCAALGLGCMHPGTYMINEGSGMYAIGISHTPIFDEAMGTNCNLSAIPGRYIIEGAVLSAGKTVDWLNDLLFASQDESYPYERFTLASRSAKPGSHGLRFSVHLAGKGTPNWDPSAHGALFHLSLMQRKEDMARAVLEGLAVSAKECLDHVVRVNRIPADVIHISGGLAKDSFFNQMLSDFLQKPLKRYLVGQATVFGAWISASVSMGLQPDYNTCFNVISTSLEEELYSPSQEHHELYRKIEKEILSYEHTVEE